MTPLFPSCITGAGLSAPESLSRLRFGWFVDSLAEHEQDRDELAKDESLWRKWCEEGVTEDTRLAVDAFFHATSKDSAEQIVDALQRWGLTKIEVKTKRTLLIFKGWEITGVEEGAWSLEKLQDRTRRYERLAEIVHGTYDRCGAMMPDK
jgi:hypothetical protein